ncbi:MAG: FlgD immunoglobulin-like domain containing protein [bacterium]
MIARWSSPKVFVRLVVALALTLALSLALLLAPPRLHAQDPPIRCVLFTHIEDATPGGMLGSPQSQQNYMLYRSRLIDMGELALSAGVQWTLQPDWKILEAALLYEDAALMATTNNKNFLRYLKEDLGVVIDPHSHESFGYNYTDVAHLIDSLGVGATTVIGGHVWDPDLPEFAEWDRFRVPVAGEQYPDALWRGDILMGSGTPNHVNDPVVSGVWRPRDRYNYFDHDSTANIAAIGQYKGSIDEIPELADLYATGEVSAEFMLTSSFHIRPSMITRPGGIAAVEDSVLAPFIAMRDAGIIVLTDFTSLVQDWQTMFASRGFLYDPNAGAPTGVDAGGGAQTLAVARDRCVPNPFVAQTAIQFGASRVTQSRSSSARVTIFDIAGRAVRHLDASLRSAGLHEAAWDGRDESGRLAPAGHYVARLSNGAESRTVRATLIR